MTAQPMKEFLANNPNFQMTVLGLLPMYHMYGQVVLIFGLMRGYKVVSMPRFIPDTFLGAIEKYKVGILFLCFKSKKIFDRKLKIKNCQSSREELC